MPLPWPTALKSRRSPKKAAPAGAVQMWVNPRSATAWPRRVAGVLMVALGLSGAIALTSGGLWLGATLLLRPHPPAWLTRYFPQHKARWGAEPPRSLADIKTELQAQGQRAGTLMALDTISTDPNVAGLWLLPVLETQTPCPEDCDLIVALRLYGEHRQTADGPELQPLDAITIRAPIQSTVMEPLSQAGVGQLTSTQALPLTEVIPLAGAALPGVWLTLSGRWRQGGSPIRYGQVIHIDHRALTVRALLDWSSPPRQLPIWRNLDQQGLPELVVNQSVGLEPNLKAYTIEGLSSPLFSLRLAQVDLQDAAINKAPARGAYNTALQLARHGLWNEAQRRLASLKQQHPRDWSLAAERQLSLIALHGNLTQTQAERAWSQPSQKLLSLLVDGRWQLALTLVKEGDGGFQRMVLPLLRQDTTGRLWRRVTATLQVNPRQPEARLWGALLLLAQKDQAAADSWLQGTQAGQALVGQFTAIATRINGPAETITVSSRPAVPHSSESAANARPPIEGWVGTATLLRAVQLDNWYADGDLALPTGHQWYQIQVDRGWVNGQWQTLAPARSAAQLWERWGAAPGAAPDLQLLNPEGEPTVTPITIVAIQQRGSQVQLLGSGPRHADRNDPGAGPWLAVSPGQFRRFQGIPQQPLTTVYQRYPEALATLGDLLELGELSATAIAADPIPGQDMTVQLQDLTGDGQADMILSPEGRGVAIVDGQGQVLFQGQRGATLWGALVNGDGSHVLMTRLGGQYRFYDWSAQGQRFE